MKEEEKDELVTINIVVARALRNRLKVYAVLNGKTIKTLITDFIISITKPEEK